MSTEQWLAEAQEARTSIDAQISMLAEVEAGWLAIPGANRDDPPGPVRELRDLVVQLEQKRATLDSQVSAVLSEPELGAEVSANDRVLGLLERSLAQNPGGTASPDHTSAVRSLIEERDRTRRQRDQSAQALAETRAEIERALGTPLPDDTDVTASVADRVRAVVDGGRGQVPEISQRPESRQVPQAVAPRDPGEYRERGDNPADNTSAPTLDVHGERDRSSRDDNQGVSRELRPSNGLTQPVLSVVDDVVDDVLDVDRGDSDDDDRADDDGSDRIVDLGDSDSGDDSEEGLIGSLVGGHDRPKHRDSDNSKRDSSNDSERRAVVSDEQSSSTEQDRPERPNRAPSKPVGKAEHQRRAADRAVQAGKSVGSSRGEDSIDSSDGDQDGNADEERSADEQNRNANAVRDSQSDPSSGEEEADEERDRDGEDERDEEGDGDEGDGGDDGGDDEDSECDDDE